MVGCIPGWLNIQSNGYLKPISGITPDVCPDNQYPEYSLIPYSVSGLSRISSYQTQHKLDIPEIFSKFEPILSLGKIFKWLFGLSNARFYHMRKQFEQRTGRLPYRIAEAMSGSVMGFRLEGCSFHFSHKRQVCMRIPM